MTIKPNPTVYIVLGIYEPNLRFLERQLRSIQAQTYGSFITFLVFDGPLAPEAQNLIAQLKDDRFVELPFKDNVGVHANFARGLTAALSKSQNQDDLFAFCDQDDAWHPDKLARQVELLLSRPECGLCHCDAQLVDQAGEQIAASLFAYENRSKRQELLDILIMNSVTGMTSIATKAVAQSASGFPMCDTPELLHDHWLALVAATHSKVVYLDAVLVDYTQHSANQLGAKPQRAPVMPIGNLLFGGRDYRDRCKQQYGWRVKALRALETTSPDPLQTRRAGLKGWAGAGRLFGHMVSRWLSGEFRQAAQSWRLLVGKFLTP